MSLNKIDLKTFYTCFYLIVWIFLFSSNILFTTAASGKELFEVRALLVPEVEATLSSRFSGLITNISVQEGERFKKGRQLVTYDCAIFRAELQKARMELEAAVEAHEANLRLQEFGSSSELEVALSSAKRKRSEAEVVVKETQVAMCSVKAPFSGRVVKLHANPHEYVKSGDEIMEILDDNTLQVHLLAPSQWLGWLKPRMTFSLTVDETGKKYEARLSRIGARVNPVNQTVELRGVIRGRHPGLLAGMSGTVVFSTPKNN